MIDRFEKELIMIVIFYFLVFLLVYAVYYYFVLKRKEKLAKFKESTEMKYLKSRYHLNLDKIDVVKTMRIIALHNAIIITTTLIVIDTLENYLMKLAVAFITVVSLQLLGFHILGKWLKRGEKDV